jgi:hypothetical protein
MFFLIFLLDDRRIRICISDKWIQMRIREARKHGSYGSGSATLVASLDLGYSTAVLRIRIRIRIHRIHVFLGLQDPDPLVRCIDPDPDPALDPDPDPYIMQNSKKNLDSYYFVTLFEFLSLKNDVNVAGKNIPVSSSQFSLGSIFVAFCPKGLFIKAVQLLFQPVSPGRA